MASLDTTIEYRRSIRMTLCVFAVICLKVIGLKMPRRIILWCARVPGQTRIGSGQWRTLRLSREEIVWRSDDPRR